MAIRYSRLVGHGTLDFEYIRWAKGRIPVAFLKQQIVLLAIISSSFLLLILTTFFTPDSELDAMRNVSLELKFSVIVDCGSSGTRAHIFTWTHDGDKVTNINLFRDSHNKPYSKHISPGLSSLRDEPEKASEYMEPVMNFISETVPKDRHIDTPIYFMATAGMRLLDQSIQRKILSDITKDLRVKYEFPKIKTQVISGENEGIYSWLSLNMNKVYNYSEGTKSIGMIEMGGASLQVTFEIEPDFEQQIFNRLGSEAVISTFQNEQTKLDLFNHHSVKLFTTTFLGLGVNSARESAIDILVRDYWEGVGRLGENVTKLIGSQVDLKDPCLTLGSKEQVLKPIELISSTNRSIGFIVGPHDQTFKVDLEGTGNFLNCLTLLERVIKTIKLERLNCPTTGNCPLDLLGTTFVPYERCPFVGLSEMFFTTNEIMNSAGLFNRKHILQETNRICSTHNDKLKQMYSKNISYEDRILYECFKATWLLTVLHNSGLRMPKDYDNFRTLSTWNGQEIDWTFGAMMWELQLNRGRTR